jgi:hypothetical protein
MGGLLSRGKSIMENLATILYYTSSAEDVDFENKIIDNIIANKGDIPVVSVSQKPLRFGKNICVGNLGKSYYSEYRQIYIGLQVIDTPIVIFCESDFLYPIAYFRPIEEELCRCSDVWILWKSTRYGNFRRKKYSEGAQIGNRDFLLGKYSDYFRNYPRESDFDKKDPLYKCEFSMFYTSQPCVSFKTGNGVRYMTNTTTEKADKLPLWGSAEDLRRLYLWEHQ